MVSTQSRNTHFEDLTMNTKTKSTGTSKPMTVRDAARIQSATAKTNGGTVAKHSFPARAMGAATKNAK